MINVAIFPGHVGKDSGAIDGYDNARSDRLYSIEAAINSSIAAYLKTYLDILELTNKIFIGSFNDRVNNSSECKMGVSIHCDWISDNSIKGFHTIYHPSSILGKRLAHSISNHLNQFTNISRMRNPYSRDDLFILNKTPFPIVLVECGYMSNLIEERQLNDPKTQKAIAYSLAATFQAFLK